MGCGSCNRVPGDSAEGSSCARGAQKSPEGTWRARKGNSEFGTSGQPPLTFSKSEYPICGVWMDWRTPTDKDMQAVFCPVAQGTDTNPVVWDYPDGMGGPRGYPVNPNRARSTRENYGPCMDTGRALGTRYNYQ